LSTNKQDRTKTRRDGIVHDSAACRRTQMHLRLCLLFSSLWWKVVEMERYCRPRRMESDTIQLLLVDKHSFISFFVFFFLLVESRTEQTESLSTTTDGIVHDSATRRQTQLHLLRILFSSGGEQNRTDREPVDHDGWNRKRISWSSTNTVLSSSSSFLCILFSSGGEQNRKRACRPRRME